MDDQLLQRDRDEGETERFGELSVFQILIAHDGGRYQAAQRLTSKQFLARRIGIDPGRRADDSKRSPAQRFGLLVEYQSALVDDEDLLQQPAYLVDQMR